MAEQCVAGRKSAAHSPAQPYAHVAFYNFCRKHMTLKTSPAVASRLTDHVWTIEELLTATAA